MLPGWARKVRDQCQVAGIPFHFKQWGHWAPVPNSRARRLPAVQKFWDDVTEEEIFMEPKGKKEAGRKLDGRTYDEFPSRKAASAPTTGSSIIHTELEFA
jgi:protein gp37